MPNAQYFTVLDAKNASYSIKIDEESSRVTTFGTPFGRYKYLRLPMGIASASEVYQQMIEQLLEGYPCKIIMDILIHGSTVKEHDRNVRMVLNRLVDIRLRLSMHKCQFRVNKVKYIGHLLTSEGLCPDQEKVDAIVQMPEPQNVSDLLRFLGMVKFLQKFIQHLSSKAAPLNELLKKDIAWNWDRAQAKTYNDLRDTIAGATTLA